MSWLSQERYETEFRAETERFADAVQARDPAATVPSCPEWTFRDLIAHVGSGHRYATEVISSGRDRPVPVTKLRP